MKIFVFSFLFSSGDVSTPSTPPQQEMMNETNRGSNNIGRRNFMEQSNNGRGGQQQGGGMMQRNHYLNPSMPGPIPSIGEGQFSISILADVQLFGLCFSFCIER